MKYEVIGNPFPVVSVDLEQGESMVCQKGAMNWMTSGIAMQTSGGGIGKMFSKAITGESMFQNTYTATNGSGRIAFGTNVPGNILAINLEGGKNIVAQKNAFLASTTNVQFEMFFQKKLGAGFFGGEGFIMQKFHGEGMLFLEIDGSVIELELGQGETMQVDTGCLAAMESTVSMNIEMVKGLGNMVFGGEGLFNTTITGPGKVWLQTMPISGLANCIIPFIPTSK